VTNPYNYNKPDWAPLERAVVALQLPVSTCGDFMWMCENPQGTHQYKHCETRAYAMLTADLNLAEAANRVAKAMQQERTA
jgi:hypothetical protein